MLSVVFATSCLNMRIRINIRSKFKFEKADTGTMPTPYSIDLHWRVLWFNLVCGFTLWEIADLLCLSERTVKRYITLFHQTGDVKPVSHRSGPQRLLGDLEQLHLFQLKVHNPGIYLRELQHRLQEAYGVRIHVSTIFCTPKFVGCTR